LSYQILDFISVIVDHIFSGL